MFSSHEEFHSKFHLLTFRSLHSITYLPHQGPAQHAKQVNQYKLIVSLYQKKIHNCLQNSRDISMCAGKTPLYWLDGPQGVQVSQPKTK